MFKTVQDIIDFYTKEAKPMNKGEAEEHEYELRDLVREYVDTEMEAGNEPTLDGFIRDCSIRELTFNEERHVEHLITVETELWKRKKPEVRESA